MNLIRMKTLSDDLPMPTMGFILTIVFSLVFTITTCQITPLNTTILYDDSETDNLGNAPNLETHMVENHENVNSEPSDSLVNTFQYHMDNNGTLTMVKQEDDRIPLYVLGLYPWEGMWNGGEALRISTSLGFESVNAHRDVLPGYTLNLIWNDTKCISGLGTYVLNKALQEPPMKHMVIGAGCSPVTQATAEVSHLWNLVQIAYSSVSPALSNKKRFPRFFRTSSPDTAFNMARIEFFKKFGWTRVAAIHQSLELFSRVTDDMVKKLPEHGISLITSEIFTDDPAIQVRKLYAYKLGMYGPKYVWFLPTWFDADYHTQDEIVDPTGCTKDEIAKAVEGSFHTGVVYLNPNEEVGISGITPKEFLNIYYERVNFSALIGDSMVGQGFDAAWAVALALNRTQEILEFRGDKRRLEDFDYADTDLGQLMLESMKKVQFQGMKGSIWFDENGDHNGMVRFARNQGGVVDTVAYYVPEKSGLEAFNWVEENPLVWHAGQPPRDSSIYVNVKVIVPKTVYGSMSALATCGILVALLLLIFNIVKRKVKLIKMSSPLMNNIILLGCIVGYLVVFIHDVDDFPGVNFCQTRTFVLMVGFSLVFGALFAKTWRVHVIFTNKAKKMVVSDYRLVGIVGVLVLADVIFFGIREAVDPQWIEKTTIDTEEVGDTVITRQVAMCKSKYQVYFLGAVYTLKGLLLLFGTFLAWGTRKVTIPALNDSQYIGMCIYNVMVLSILGVVLGFVLQEQVTINYAMTSAFLLLGTTTTQLIIFIPKILKLRDAKVNDESESYTKTTFRVKGAAPGSQNDNVDDLVKSLEAQLDQKNKIIADFEAKVPTIA